MSAPTRPIIITGFMGAGKTTLAAALAERLACGVIDLDKFIKEREGRTPQIIIDEDGEARFREIESLALHDALETAPAGVIALGGGTWTIERNRSLINERDGFTVWLDAPFELCWQRIESENNVRPLARERTSALSLYDERRTLYSQARLRVEVTGSESARAIAEVIITALALFDKGRQ